MANRVLIPAIAARPALPPPHPAFVLAGETMGTSWRLLGYGGAQVSARRLEGEIAVLLDTIIDEMSPWRAYSLLNRFNDAAAGAWLTLPAHFRNVVECALEIAQQSDGAFDPTLGALADLWGLGARAPERDSPTNEEVTAARRASGWRRLQRDGDRLRQPGGLRLDLNGIAKGYAVDEVARCASHAGLTSYLIEIGGELVGKGVKPDGQPWWVEVERPPGSDAALILAALCDTAIATSGDYRRRAVVDGISRSHTLSPDTGAPITNAVASVTVLHQSCMRADAYATAIQVLGPIAGMAFAERNHLPVIMAVRTASGFDEHISSEARRLLQD